MELKLCAAAKVRELLGASDAAAGVDALTVFSCLAGGDYDRGADRLGPKHAAVVVKSLLAALPEVRASFRAFPHDAEVLHKGGQGRYNTKSSTSQGASHVDGSRVHVFAGTQDVGALLLIKMPRAACLICTAGVLDGLKTIGQEQGSVPAASLLAGRRLV